MTGALLPLRTRSEQAPPESEEVSNVRTDTLQLLSVLPLAELVAMAGEPAAPRTLADVAAVPPLRPPTTQDRVEEGPAAVGCPG